MDLEKLNAQPHRRFNPLTGDWVLISPNRTQRPWQGQTELQAEPVPRFDPKCYLCPGNSRAGGTHNPAYTNTFVFDNDFASLKPNQDESHFEVESDGLLVAERESGKCRVVCFSPRHDLTLPLMDLKELESVVHVWATEYQALGSGQDVNYVQIFENRGAMMGCSNPHPHCQIWASKSIPNEPRREAAALVRYSEDHGTCLLCDYVAVERIAKQRIVCENDHFVAIVPFWAVWPFETLVLSTRHLGDIGSMTMIERAALAEVLKRLTTRYDNLFETSFPYSMGFHQTPTDGFAHPESHFHTHFYPPLLRSATIRKFMVGYELLASPQRDITPESAAERLSALSEAHYTLCGSL